MATVLLVEDDPDQLDLREQILSMAGHTVLPAKNAAEALAHEVTAQVAVLDLRIPTLTDGVSLIQRLQERAPSMKLIVLSGWTAGLTVKVGRTASWMCSTWSTARSPASSATSAARAGSHGPAGPLAHRAPGGAVVGLSAGCVFEALGGIKETRAGCDWHRFLRGSAWLGIRRAGWARLALAFPVTVPDSECRWTRLVGWTRCL